jgi:hypothetical protein
MTTRNKQRPAHDRALDRRPFLALSAVGFGLGMVLALAVGPMARAADLKPMTLVNEGPARQLPQRILGASAGIFVEHVLDTPQTIAAYKAVQPAVVRFPGGSYANFYNWRSGQIEIAAHPNSSDYVKFWSNLASMVKRSFPQGIHLDDFMPFARETGADVTLVVNLETSSVEEQVAWFKTLAEKGILPKTIELGNEFWAAMAGDRDSLKRWPDVKTSMETMHRYERALRPYVGPGGKFAVQASLASFVSERGGSGALVKRLWDWNDGLKPEDWFEAVTTHLYPGGTYLMKYPEAKTHEGFFRLMLGRVDSGTERHLDELAQQLPGKEIWVTEWNPQGGNFKDHLPDLLTPDVRMHLATRMNLAILRQPAVTQSLYFMLHSSSDHGRSHIVSADGKLEPLPAIQALTWLNMAANGGASFQRVVEAGGALIDGLKSRGDHYRSVEGAWFRSSQSATLILHNASDVPRRLTLASLNPQPPTLAEAVVADKLDDAKLHAARVQSLTIQDEVRLPALSVTRLVWSTPGK